MAYSSRIAWETLRSIASTALTGAYEPLGTPLAHPSYILKMVNTGTTDVLVSIDGVNAVDICPAGGFWLYDEGKIGLSAGYPGMPEGTQIFINGAAGTSGTIYLVSQFIVYL
jgi:hypothetical protein